MTKMLDRNYFRMLFDEELIQKAKDDQNELALALAERLEELLAKPSRYVEHMLTR